jgi:TetR/AcrR family transcriptional repressor of nem operon
MGTLHAIAPPDGARKDNASDADMQFRHTRSLAAKQRGDTRSAIIWCGTELLTERGFQITGIDEILSIVGVPKGSFYYYFKSKHEFGVAVVDNYVQFYAQKMALLFDNPERTPLQRLQDFVDDGKLGMAKYDFKRGCLIGNMGQELAALNDEFRERLEQVMQTWEARVTTLFALARDTGEIAQSHDPESLSQFFWIGWEGAILRSKLTRSVAPLDRFAQIFFSKVLRH